MNLKFCISFFLLLTYTFGFAHNLIPHCQELAIGEKQNISHHHHEHHQHQSEEETNPDHEHIPHEDHFDAGIYDLILCILSEAAHPSSECNVDLYFPINGNDSIKELTKANLLGVLFTLFQFPEQSDTLSVYIGEGIALYLTPPLDNSPSRGPPYFSC